MKTTNYIVVLACLISFQIKAQHDLTEHLFTEKGLYQFEQDLELTQADVFKADLLEYVSQEYTSFHLSIEQRIEGGEQISENQFEQEWNTLVSNVKNHLGNFNQSPLGVASPKVLNGPCVNMDFETGDLTGWDLSRGNVDGSAPFSYVAPTPAVPGPFHQIFAGGVDPVTGIPCVNPLGGNFSVRLGDGTGTGARAARMTQSFLVDPNNFMFTYSYAVVFQSPAGHGLNQLPYFTVRVFDEQGNSVPCGEYSVIADAANAPNYQSTNAGGSVVLFQNWQTVFTNLSAFIGQNVTIEFTAGDCSLTGHYGYAYVDASCGMQQVIASQNTICTGQATVLTAPPGAASYLWNTGQTTQSISVTAGGTYTCTLTPFQGGGCSIDLSITITEFPQPTALFTPGSPTVCVNSPIQFTDNSSIPNPGVITTYQWDFGDGTVTPASSGNVSGVPNTSGSYTAPLHTYTTPGNYVVQLTVTSADGCTDTYQLPMVVNPLPVVAAGPDQVVCSGSSVTLSGSGAQTYLWDNGVVDGVSFTPAVGSLLYTVTGTDANGCQSTDQVTVTVNPLPVVNAGPDQVVCAGTQVTLQGSGAQTYAWDNGITNAVAFTPAVGTTIYTVTGTDVNGCQNTDQVNVTVNPLPVIGAGPDQFVCEGVPVILSGSGGVSYSWSSGTGDGVAFFPPLGTTIYTVTGTDANGCQNTDQVSVTVYPSPVVEAGPDQEICIGQSVTLSGSGAQSYVWDQGVVDGVAFFPTSSMSYTVEGTDANGCTAVDAVHVYVHQLPNVDAGPDHELCTGGQITLQGSGAQTYTWDNGVTNGVAFTPAVGSTIYTVTGTDANGCQNTDQVNVTVNPLPVIGAGPDQFVCEGVPVILSGSGGVSYSWSSGTGDGVAFFPPLGTTIYTVTGTDANGCQNTDQVSVTVYPSPVVEAGPDQEICIGQSVTLSGSGAQSYVWDQGVVDGVAFFPTSSMSYTVEGTDVNGCTAVDALHVYVHQLPNVNAGPDHELCSGGQITLQGSGAQTYTWDNGVINGDAFTPPVGTMTYTVVGTDSYGCQNTDQAVVTVYALPNVDAGPDQEVCENTQVVLTATGAVSYVWNPAIQNGVAFTAPVGVNTYSVTGTDNHGCQNTDQVSVTVHALPNVDAGPDQEVCEGQAVTLSGSGAQTYVWSGGISNGIAVVLPVGLHNFTVDGTDGNGCVNDDAVLVTVHPNPEVDAGANQTGCEGEMVVLNATGSTNLYWDGGYQNGVPFNQAIGVMTYYVHDSLATGCTAMDSVIVIIHPRPIVTTENKEICEGEAVVLEGQGAQSYVWSDGVINGVPFYPTSSHFYTVVGTSAYGCIDSAVAKVEVHPLPYIDFSIHDPSLMTSAPITGFTNLSVGAVSFDWNFGDGSLHSTEFEPTHEFPGNEPGTYEIILTGVTEFGCKGEKIKYVYVQPDFTVYVPNTFTPDNNGVNEVFKPVMEGFDEDEYTLYIFNRWGDLIFESHNMEVGWDGSYAGRFEQVQDGVYTWKIEAGLKYSTDVRIFVGHVSLLK